MKRILSLFLAAVMLFTTAAISFSTQAEDSGKCISVTLKGKYHMTDIKTAFDSVNKKRQSLGYGTLAFDSELTSIAKKRAAQVILHVDEEESLPNGDPITSLIPNYGYYDGTAGLRLASLTEKNIESTMNSILTDSSNESVVSCGAAVYEYSGTYTFYMVYSVRPSASAYTDFTDVKKNYTDSLLASFVNDAIVNLAKSSNNKYYNLSCKIKPSGFFSDYIKVANSQVKYKSSKPTVFKVKGTKGYVKKKGAANINVYSLSGSKLGYSGYTFTVSNATTTISSLASNKKKRFTVKWSNYTSNAAGFQVQYSTDKSFKKNVKTLTVKGKSKRSKTVSNLKSKKKYYVRVRVYIDQGDNEKMYGSWSKKKAVTIK